MNKYWVIAESETFFLPNLLASLANNQRIEGIIEIKYRSDLRKKLLSLFKMIRAFDLTTSILIFFCILWANIINLIFSNRFYSIRKVATYFRLPYYNVNGFEDEILSKILEEKIKSNPVFVQVGRKVPARLTNEYVLINKHCSILPAYAGVNPVFWRMLKKEKYQGVTVHRMDENFDTGKILLQSKIENRGNLFSIYHTLYDLTSELLLELKSQDTLDNEEKKTGLDLDYSYYSYPNQKDIKAFLKTGNKFGLPFRLHPRLGGL